MTQHTTLITGASRGIGAALAETLTAQGQRVIGTSTTGGDGLHPLDLTRDGQAQALAGSLALDRLDLLVCNAGVFPDRHEALDDGYPSQMWATSFAVNVAGVFATVQAFLPAVRAAKGKIAIISTQMASQERAPGGAYIYRASKAAALNLGRNLAVDLKDDGVAVGIYHPGWVRTDMGGAGAALDPSEAAAGLADRFAALSMETSGCFETWDGHPHPY